LATSDIQTGDVADLQVAEHALQHHFADMEQQQETSTFGMWMFLLTEIMFFGGLFTVYLVYRASYYQAFVEGSQKLSVMLGGINTAVLICSSLTMALGVRAAQTGKPKLMVVLLFITILFGLGFLGIKGDEYHEHWENHEFPGQNFHFQTIDKSPPVDPQHTEIFFSLYWAMTGLHALHMVIGVGLVSWLIIAGLRGAFTPSYFTPVEIIGLYWHFVDLVWIYLFPLLYLISKKHGGG
jgi:cytochrome c oxidase subunit III